MVNKVRIRTGHKSYGSQLLAQLTNITNNFDPVNDEDRLTSAKQALSERLAIIKELDEEILLTLTDPQEIDTEITDSGAYRLKACEVILKAERLIQRADDDRSDRSNSNSRTGSRDSGCSLHSHAKMPTLNLPKFGGETTEFRGFWDSFEATVHNNPNYNPITKLTYLKGLLQGKAKDAISGLTISSDSYLEAVDILQSRFGNQQLLISSHMTGLLSIPSVDNLSNSKQLRTLYDCIEAHVRNLRALNVDSQRYGCVLIPLVMSKLPSEVTLIISRRMPTTNNDGWKIEDFLQILRSELESREMSEQLSNSLSVTSPQMSRRRTQRNHNGPTYSAAVLVNETQVVTCTYCKKDHRSTQCTVISDWIRIGLTSDIKSAFLSVRVAPENRDVLRFLWVDDISKTEPKIVIKRFTSVIFGVSSSPFLLLAALNVHMTKLTDSDPSIASTFLRDLYMDDNVTGGRNVNELYEYYSKVKGHMALGGFDVRKWTTSDETLRNLIGRNENSDESDAAKVMQKVLGVIWDSGHDLLIFDLASLKNTKNGIPTKRSVLSAIAGVYDPMGVLSPMVIRLKCVFQELCKIKGGWDDPLSESFTNKWNRLLHDCNEFIPIKFPRFYLYDTTWNDVEYVEMHGFCDASALAYACIVYICPVMKSGERLPTFVASKSRVAPIKVMSIPYLELLSCLILSQLLKTILDSMGNIIRIKETFCWTECKLDALPWEA